MFGRREKDTDFVQRVKKIKKDKTRGSRFLGNSSGEKKETEESERERERLWGRYGEGGDPSLVKEAKKWMCLERKRERERGKRVFLVRWRKEGCFFWENGGRERNGGDEVMRLWQGCKIESDSKVEVTGNR